MKTICFYFQVHQPLRLKKYRFFNMGKDHLYLDDYANRTIMQKVARRCYLPMNELLLKLIRENGKKFKVAFSISGIAIEQFRMYAPEVLDSFQALARTGCVEFWPKRTPTRWPRWSARRNSSTRFANTAGQSNRSSASSRRPFATPN